jgi:hypothetical protein
VKPTIDGFTWGGVVKVRDTEEKSLMTGVLTI